MTQKQFRGLRPARNLIVQMLWVCLAVVSWVQIIDGVSPDSANNNVNRVVQYALAVTVIFVSSLNLTAAWVKHSGISLGMEIFAMLFGTGGFLCYALIIVETNDKWWATASFAWSIAMLIGCGLRSVQIFRRGY